MPFTLAHPAAAVPLARPKHPLAALAPGFVQARIASALEPPGRLPAASWSGVLLSLLAGAATHLVWDSFTHFSSPLAAALPVLRAHVFSAFGHPLYLCKLLQHVSTVLGVALLARWAWRGLREAPLHPAQSALPLSFAMRCAVLVPAISFSGAATLGTAAGVAERVSTPWHLESLARNAAISGMSVLGICLVVFAILWHARLIPPRARA